MRRADAIPVRAHRSRARMNGAQAVIAVIRVRSPAGAARRQQRDVNRPRTGRRFLAGTRHRQRIVAACMPRGCGRHRRRCSRADGRRGRILSLLKRAPLLQLLEQTDGTDRMAQLGPASLGLERVDAWPFRLTTGRVEI